MTALARTGIGQLPVTVITGFLGSGKTTLLAKLLRHPSMGPTAVIINEFGAIGLDHDLVESSDETTMALLNGCLCCTVRGDLVDTIRKLYLGRTKGEIAEFERLVIETTGLADPAPILQTLMADPMVEHYFRLDGVITLIDATSGDATLDCHIEAVKQAAVADRLVITKTDLAISTQLASLHSRLRVLNPGAAIMEACHGDIAAERLLDVGLFDPRTKTADVRRWLMEDAYPAAFHGQEHDHAHGHGHDVNRHDEHIQAFCIRHATPIPGAAASFFLTVLMGQCGPDLLRVKGILNIAETPDTPMVIHCVQHVVHAPVHLDAWPSADRDSRIVFITRDVSKSEIDTFLNALLRTHEHQELASSLPPPSRRQGNMRETL